MEKDYYQILGVSRNASQEEIRKAYRELARKYHPDRAGGDEQKFKEINEAYQVLSDKEKRAQYDRFGKNFEGFQSGDFGWGGGINWEDLFGNFGFRAEGESGFHDFGFGDIFSEIFRARGTEDTIRTKRGRDIEIEVEITLEEAFRGVSKTVKFQRYVICPVCRGSGAQPGYKLIQCSRCGGKGKVRNLRRTFFGVFSEIKTCPVCQGRGKIPEKKCSSCNGKGRILKSENLAVNIPKGIRDGEKILLSGHGDVGWFGNKAGNLIILVRVLPHPLFVREGDDIYYKAHIDALQAMTGGQISIPTLEGPVLLKLPEGTQYGEKFRLRGKGMPKLNRRGRGDEIVEILIDIPKKLPENIKTQLQEIKKKIQSNT